MEILTHIIAFIGGLGASHVVRIAISSRKSKSTDNHSVNQSGNHAGGDIIGGNKHTGKD